MSLRTIFSEAISEEQPLTEYPRPMLKRDSYINLNGIWDYAFTKEKKLPEHFEGHILVPFSPECELSGVNRQLMPDEYLWYHRIINDPRTSEEQRVLLQFGAVDQYAGIYVNHKLVTAHMGGYLPFTADITDYLTQGANSLIVLVTDVSDTSYHARGKQKLKPSGMFYTAQSGIWQSVFMECVPSTYINSIKTSIDFDASSVTFDLEVISKGTEASHSYAGNVKVYGLNAPTTSIDFINRTRITVTLNDVKPWSPEHPFLYDASITYGKDQIETYFAMRKISSGMDENQIMRIFLNNKPYFQSGLLDQGYWPESLYTAPSDEAIIYDIKTAKELGYNMLRKHAKIETQRWYYHCDRLGMLVWQDFVNGGSTYKSWFVTYVPTIFPFLSSKIKDSRYTLFSRTSKEGRDEFIREMKDTVKALYNHPSIILWTIFNEGWGQFDSKEVTDILKEIDSSRLIDTASGWFDRGNGDVKSRHIYFTPMRFHPEKNPLVLSEFGGYTLRIPNHSYSEAVYGYRHYKTEDELTDAIKNIYEKKILPGINNGLCATVYTQLTDIEEEINGLITYDRKELKVTKETMIEINKQLCKGNMES